MIALFGAACWLAGWRAACFSRLECRRRTQGSPRRVALLVYAQQAACGDGACVHSWEPLKRAWTTLIKRRYFRSSVCGDPDVVVRAVCSLGWREALELKRAIVRFCILTQQALCLWNARCTPRNISITTVSAYERYTECLLCLEFLKEFRWHNWWQYQCNVHSAAHIIYCLLYEFEKKSTSFDLYNHDRMSLSQLICLSLLAEFAVSLQHTV